MIRHSDRSPLVPRLLRLLGALWLLAGSAPAGAIDYRVRWRPPQDPRVNGYNVYVRPEGSAYGAPRRAGLPPLESDGTMAFVASGFTTGVRYFFAVTGTTSDGAESPFSNEIGPCTTAAECDDHSPCTVDSCVSGHCQYALGTDGVSCADGDLCNGAETCLAGICRAGAPLDCDDGDACTADVCSPTGGCSHTEIAGCASCTAGVLATLEGKRVGLFKSVYGIHMVSTGILAPSVRVDPMRTGITFEVIDESGKSLFHAVVPPSALEANAAGKGGYHLSRLVLPQDVGGLTLLRLRVRNDGKIIIAAQGRGGELPETLPARVTWVAAMGVQCGVDTCLITARKSNCRQ